MLAEGHLLTTHLWQRFSVLSAVVFQKASPYVKVCDAASRGRLLQPMTSIAELLSLQT